MITCGKEVVERVRKSPLPAEGVALYLDGMFVKFRQGKFTLSGVVLEGAEEFSSRWGKT